MRPEDNPSENSDDNLLIDELADEFVTRKQAGQSPTISEYCQQYPELEAQIRSIFPMLSILEQAKSAPKSGADDSLLPFPERVGDYHLIREIGRGGMGVIYEARHLVVGRNVALKILPQRLSTDQRAQARFEREARAIAGIHHTNVVPLFEFGKDEDVRFLVMQLIDGESVDKLISRLRHGEANDSILSVVNCEARPTDDAELCESKQLPSSTEALVGATSAADATSIQRFAEVATIGMQIASALDYAHGRGIVHRDVKPSNILLDRSGIAWLTDFGLAKTDDEDLTQTGDFLGTLRYTAPERFRGDCDGRSDLYALGLTLYELLTLRPAFEAADRIQLLHDIEHSPPCPLSKTIPPIPKDLQTIVSKAIEHDPAARYATASDMADDLQRFLNDEPIRARKLSGKEKLVRWRRRNVALANSLGLLVIIVLVTIIGAVASSIREAGLRRQAEAAVSEANLSRRALQQTLYFAEMNLAGEASRAAGGTSRVRDLLEHWRTSDLGPEMRGWEWYYLESLCHRQQSTLTPQSDSLAIYEVAWNPAGTKLALAQQDGSLTIWDAVSAQQLEVLKGPTSAVLSVAWSPDGSRLASGNRHGKISMWDAESGAHICQIRSGEGEIQSVRWSPDSTSLAWGLGRAIYVCDANLGADIRKIGTESDLFSVNVIQWSPDNTSLFAGNWWQNVGGIWNVSENKQVEKLRGRLVKWKPGGHEIDYWLTADNTGQIQVWDADHLNPIQSLRGHSANVRSLDWSRDGRHLVSAGEDRSLCVWDWDTRSLQDVLQGHTDQVLHAAWHPQGSRIASVSNNGAAMIWEVLGGPVITFEGPQTRVQHIAWHPHGDQLAGSSRDGDVHLWDVAANSRATVLTGFPRQVEAVEWRPDGAQLVTADRNGTLRIWDAKTHVCLQELSGHVGTALAVAWHPNSNRLATTGSDRALRLWDLRQTPCDAIARQIPIDAQCVRWNPQGTLVAIGDKLGLLHLWDLDNKQPVASWTAHDDSIADLAWSPDGLQIATSSTDDTSKIWSIDREAHAATDLEPRLNQVLQGHYGPVWSIDWSPAGNRLATGSRDGTVRIWDPNTGSQVLTLRAIRQTGELWCVRWSPDGRRLAAGSANRTVTMWDASTGYAVTGD